MNRLEYNERIQELEKQCKDLYQLVVIQRNALYAIALELGGSVTARLSTCREDAKVEMKLDKENQRVTVKAIQME